MTICEGCPNRGRKPHIDRITLAVDAQERCTGYTIVPCHSVEKLDADQLASCLFEDHKLGGTLDGEVSNNVRSDET